MHVIFYLAYGKSVFAMMLVFFSYKGKAQETAVTFTSPDKKIEQAFEWAKGMTLHYKDHLVDAAAGAGYESPLVPNDAFYMPDVSHQSIDAKIRGLTRENYIMFSNPTLQDYHNDQEFLCADVNDCAVAIKKMPGSQRKVISFAETTIAPTQQVKSVGSAKLQLP